MTLYLLGLQYFAPNYYSNENFTYHFQIIMDSYLIDLKNYEKLDLIGEGSFGKVYLTKEKKTGNIYAAKVLITSITNNSKMMRDISREINTILKVHHPSIIRFIGYSPTNFENESKPVIITDYIPNGTLKDLIDLSIKARSPEKWNDTRKLITLYGIASGMSFLHSHNILHRDLKPANILFDKYLFPVICDFGLSKEENSVDQSTSCLKGTPLYLSPEIIVENEYLKEGDVYAFAIITYQLFINETPFNGLNNGMKIYNKVVKGDRPEIICPIYDKIVEMIKACWEQSPSDRPSFDEIKEILKDPEFYEDMLIDVDIYENYIEFIDSRNCTFDENAPKFTYQSLQANEKFKKIDIPKVIVIYEIKYNLF